MATNSIPEETAVLFEKGADARKLVHLELLVLWRVRIIKGLLFEGEISADKSNQPAVLLVKILNNGK